MPSAVAFSRDLLPIGTTATSGGGYVFRFDSTNALVPLPGLTASTWTQPTYASSAATANATALYNTFAALRTVAFGIKIETRQSAFAANGFVHIGLAAEVDTNSVTTFSYPTSVSQMEFLPYYKRIPIADLIEDDIMVVGRYTDVGTAFRYINPNPLNIEPAGYVPAWPATGWSAIIVWVEALGVTGPAIDVEVIHHYEALTQSATSSGIIDVTKAAPHSPIELAATSYLVDRVDPVQVNREDEENKGNFWQDVGRTFNIGLKVASGIFPVLAPFSAAFDALKI
jgi:hypothetical protein